jgi:hypothetical protein
MFLIYFNFIIVHYIATQTYFYAKASYLSGTGELLKLIQICLLNYSYNYNYFNSNYLIRIVLLLLLFLFIFIIKAAS